jgi:hypothetical protein
MRLSRSFMSHLRELQVGPESPERLRQPGELLEMERGQATQSLGASSRQSQPDAAVIITVAPPADEPGALGAVHEPDGAVVPQQELLGDVTDGRPAPVRVAPDDQEQLMLGGRQPDDLGLLLAPTQEATQTRAELQETPVLVIGDLFFHIYIVARYKLR